MKFMRRFLVGKYSLWAVFALIFVPGAMFVLAQDNSPTQAVATMVNVNREPVGTVVFEQREGYVYVAANVEQLTPGFHGFHVHRVGLCEDTDKGPFRKTSGHWNPTDEPHGRHAGDFPNLLAMEDGTATLAFTTDRFTVAELFDEDGSSLSIYDREDNMANIPLRYGGPDEGTLEAGDAGERVACGIILAG
jgi:Cu-Zn family superoxide dismutase